MNNSILQNSTQAADSLKRLWFNHRVWFVTALIFVALVVFNQPQGFESARFVLEALFNTAPFLLLSIGVTDQTPTPGK